MQNVTKRGNKTIEEYRHNVKLLKYHLKKQQKINETLRYKDSKKNKKQSLIKQNKTQDKHPLYAMLDTVASLTLKMKEIGLSLGDVFRMADSAYRGEITKEQFMNAVSRIKANLEQTQINQMFYAIDSNLNGMLSSDQYEEFLNAHGGTENKAALAFQKEASEKFMALLKKKNLKAEDFARKLLNPIPLEDMNSELKKLGLNINQIMILFKMWDPALTGLIKQEVLLKSMQTVKQKDERQIQNEKYEKGIKQLCVIFRDRKINPIQIFEVADFDGKEGVSVFELEDGFRKLMPEETTYQIKKWVGLININNDNEITKEEFISAIRSFYSIQKIESFSTEYEKLHPKLKKVLAEEEIPAEKIINQLSIYIEDNGLTKTEVFHRIDINHNGLIDKSELCEGLKGLGINIGFIGKVLAVFDRDASGEIGLQEWLSILGEDLQMEDVQYPGKDEEEKDEAKPVAKPAKQIKKPKQKEKEKEKEKEKKETKKQAKKSVDKSPPKEQAKSKQPPKPSKINESAKKTPIDDKASKRITQSKNPIKKEDSKKPLKDQTQNSSLPNKNNPTKIQQSKKDDKNIKKTSKKDEEPFQNFADQEINEVKQTFSEDEINTEQIQKQIGENYAKSPKKIKDIFAKCSKNNKKGLSERQLSQFFRELKLKTEYDDKVVKKIFEDNCSNNGLITTDWFQRMVEQFDLKAKEQQSSVEPSMKTSKSKKSNENMLTLKNDTITSKIPKVLEEKVQHEEQNEYDNEQFNFEEDDKEHEESEVKPTKRSEEKNMKNDSSVEHRGKDNENFQQLQEHTLQPQTITDEGYKLKKFIKCEEELTLLQEKYSVTANSIKKNKKPYQDKAFPANLASLTHLPPNQSSISNVTLLKWKHYKEIYKNAELFKSSISPNDIKQGTLGDCYFLCSLAALAEYKNLIERLFEYYDVDNGYFLVWVCIDGSWRLIELDGYIPVVPQGNRPAFSHGDEEELWVMLLEKAYAKAYGNYEKINGGQPYEAIKDLTGAPGQSFCHTNQQIKIDDIWKKLEDANREQFIMTCGTDVDKEGKIKMEGHSESITNEGLVLGHAYSILDVRTYKKQRLIQLRNPWGDIEWNGHWSDKSPKWTEDAKKQLGYTRFQDDGIFWMPFQAYFQKYNTTAINYLRPSYFYSSKMYKGVKSLVMKIPEGSLKHGFVMATQKDHRKDFLPPNTPYNMNHIMALEYKKKKLTREISNEKYLYQRQGSAQITADDDSEIVVLINLERSCDLNLCTYSDRAFEYEVDLEADAMMQCIEDVALMESRAKNVQENPGIFKTWITSVGQFAFLVVKSIAKKSFNFSMNLPTPKNLQLLSSNKLETKITPGAIKSVKGRIINMAGPYSFGPQEISYDGI